MAVLAEEESAAPGARAGSIGEVFLAFLRLGCTSFGGPIAHLGYFRQELVVRRRWLDDVAFAELVGLCQFLPGPASSQVCFGIGLNRAGALGGPAAWVAFSLPSALLMFGFALIAGQLQGPVALAAIHGLKVAAVAIVAQALIGMARSLAPDMRRRLLALAAGALMLVTGIAAMQVAVIAAGAIAGMVLCRQQTAAPRQDEGWSPPRWTGLACLLLCALLFLGLPLLGRLSPGAAFAAILYRAGALVFGGGHVVLPLLRSGLVPHWMSDGTFLAGYGAAQALPGPLFTIGAYLGAEALPRTAALAALIGALALSAPGLLLLAGVLPFRRPLAESATLRSAIAGINAVVVGILGAALYDPLWKTGILGPFEAGVAIAGCAALLIARLSPLLLIAAATTLEVGASLL